MKQYHCTIFIGYSNERRETHQTTVEAENRTEAKTMAFEHYMYLADEIVANQPPDSVDPPIFMGSEVALIEVEGAQA